jgi:hypothetical protein
MMKIEFEYTGQEWDCDSTLKIIVSDKVQLFANKEALESLAKLCLLYSQDETYVGRHVHLDDMVCEDGSHELVISKGGFKI